MSPISEDDLDRLADYAAGVLGAAEAAEVKRLIASDPAWAEAHAGLVAAQPWLDEALSGLPREPMPGDVAARLDGAIAAAREAGKAGLPTQRVGTGESGGAPRGAGLAEVVPLKRWRRRYRIALGTAAAAVVAAGCIGGVAALRGSGTQSASSGSARVAGPAATPRKLPPAAVPGNGPGAGIPTTASGADYTHDTLALAGSGSASGAPTVGQAQSVPDVPDGLARLSDPAALGGCLAAITAGEGGRPVSADYARYQGQPALIVVLSGGSARVVAVGPDCGVAGSGAALLDSLS